MDERNEGLPSPESIQKAMELAWADHHHARNQTWKTIELVSVLGAGLLAIDFKYMLPIATLCAAILVIVMAAFGILITWNHRKLEVRKFTHIMNCEEALGLHKKLIPTDPKADGAVKLPTAFKFLDIIKPWKHNTALFILRMHIAIILFAVLVVVLRFGHN